MLYGYCQPSGTQICDEFPQKSKKEYPASQIARGLPLSAAACLQQVVLGPPEYVFESMTAAPPFIEARKDDWI